MSKDPALKASSAKTTRALKLALPLLGCLLLLAGCASSGKRPAPGEMQTVAEGGEALSFENNQFLGHIIHVDMEEKVAVVQVEARIGIVRQPLLARDIDLNTTAILTPSPHHKGQVLGVMIEQGEPAVGDEVILPGATWQAMISDKLGK